jgi:hypothetical protein
LDLAIQGKVQAMPNTSREGTTGLFEAMHTMRANRLGAFTRLVGTSQVPE